MRISYGLVSVFPYDTAPSVVDFCIFIMPITFVNGLTGNTRSYIDIDMAAEVNGRLIRFMVRWLEAMEWAGEWKHSPRNLAPFTGS